MSEKAFETTSDITLEESHEIRELAHPPAGEYPYVRGIHKGMYRNRLWTMRQYAGFGSAVESNARYHYLLERGVSGLSVAFDLPTQMGLDPDNALAKGEVGRVGVSIAHVEDMHTLFKGISLNDVSVSMTINATAPVLLAFLLVVAEETGCSVDGLRGTIQNDILKEYIARGTYIYPAEHGLRLVGDVFAYCKDEVRKWNTISVSGYHMREAGANAVQELGFTFANAICYLETAKARGLAVDDVAPQMSFFFNCHNNFLEEIAKFRAARLLWSEITKDMFDAKNPKSSKLRFHTQTAGSSLTAQQAKNNVVRTTVQALAAVLGGTQSLHTNSFDEALGLPTEESAELALRTQQIIAYESGVTMTADPLGGSAVIEHLTSELYSRAKKEIEKVQALGGMRAAIDADYPQQQIEDSAYRYQRAIESGDKTIVGVNAFEESEGSDVPIQKINPKLEKQQLKLLKKVRKKRKSDAVQACLQRLREAAKTDENTMPHIVAAARSRATLGEIAGALKDVFGPYRGNVSS